LLRLAGIQVQSPPLGTNKIIDSLKKSINQGPAAICWAFALRGAVFADTLDEVDN
jgi:hypothetical protein